MPQRKKTTANRKRRPNASVSELKSIRDLLENQNTKEAPQTRDVIWRPPRESKVHVFLDSWVAPVIVSNVTLPVSGSIATTLNSGGQGPGVVSLFDAYRIRMVKVTFTPLTSLGANQQQGPLYIVIDYDDSATLTLTQATQYSSLQLVPYGQFTERVFVPNAANALYSGSAFTDYGRAPNSAWIDTANPNTPYYGLKYYLPVGTTNNNQWAVTVHHIIEAKNTR